MSKSELINSIKYRWDEYHDLSDIPTLNTEQASPHLWAAWLAYEEAKHRLTLEINDAYRSDEGDS